MSGCVSDNCSEDSSLIIRVVGLTDDDAGPCQQTLTITFVAEDECGNISGSFSCTDIFIDDTPPTITGVGADDTIRCSEEVIFSTPTSSDNCSSTNFSFMDDTVFSGLTFVITRTWTATDICDSTTTATQVITVLPNSATVIDTSICDGDSYFAGGADQTQTGTYFDTLVAANGCDSVVTTNLTVLPNSLTIIDTSICDGDSYFAAGTDQTQTGTYFDTLVSANGCDSVITTNLTVLPNASTILDITICAGETYLAGGDCQTQTGTYFDTLVAANGCDSVNISVRVCQ